MSPTRLAKRHRAGGEDANQVDHEQHNRRYQKQISTEPEAPGYQSHQ